MKKYLLVLSIILYSTAGFSHGENKPGPHNGHIRMPGAFHTELLIQENKVVIYLLDISFKHPTTKNSTVEIRLKTDTAVDTLSCKAVTDRFLCDLPEGRTLASGQLAVDAVRDSVTASTATYELPLKF